MNVTGVVTHTLYENGNFSIRTFRCSKTVELPNGNTSRSFHIKGNFIPNSQLDIELEGEFDAKPYVKNGVKSFTFNVEKCDELKIAEETSILKYLQSLRGVGFILAKRIYKKFGTNTFQILDDDIENLKQVFGIGKRKYQMIAEDYLSRGAAKELYIYLYQFHVPNSRIQRIYMSYKGQALEEVKSHPYSFYINGMLPFDAADRIGKQNGHDSLSDERIQASVIEALKRSEQEGHTYLEWKDLITETQKLLETLNRSVESQKKVAVMIRSNTKFLTGTHVVYDTIGGKVVLSRKVVGDAERNAAESIKRLLSSQTNIDYLPDILEAEKELNITLSDEQRTAVQTALNSGLSIVTGGPGTGKTSFQKVLLKVYKEKFNGQIVLCAPTGRAARRMTEQSSYPATTLHQKLRLIPDENGELDDPEPITAGLIIVDEMSMVDIMLADKFFSAVQNGTKVVCVGDVFQLPSVGCGEVLKDMIDSKVIPTTRFTKIFRQQDGSLIAANAAAINTGDCNLEYGPAFTFIERKGSENIAAEILKQYEEGLKEYGEDETTVLTPYRKSTETGVNLLNPNLKEIFNPSPEHKSRTNKVDGMDIYVGDKVMFTKNMQIDGMLLSNGDIGYVTNIALEDNIQNVIVDFRDGRIVALMGEDVKCLVPAYATTVHKSQGGEYKCCIIAIDPKHNILLIRNLVYTAITRAKEKVIIVGSKEAFFDSIKRADSSRRCTLLQERLTDNRTSLNI